MTTPVTDATLAEHVHRLGSVAHLVTVGDDGPHVVSVAVSFDGTELTMGAGRHTASNVSSRPIVTLLWGAPAGETHSLIVDGEAQLVDEDRALRVRPTRAVLHRVADADASLPSCVTLL